MFRSIRGLRGWVVCIVAAAAAPGALAEEVTLRALSAFHEGTFFSRNFERFIEKVNRDGKGLVQIKYVGGPKAIPTLELGNALRTGVADMANIASSFYTNAMPEADAQKLGHASTAEQRRSGAWDYLNRLHNEKVNAWFLAKQHANIPFHLYLNKPIRGADLTGLKIRVSPATRDFFAALGATTVNTAPGEVYTALERGIVDGYGWPAVGIFDLSWHEKTKYRVDPPFYRVDVAVLVNLAKWKSLDAAQQKVLNDAALWLESLDQENDALIASERDKQAKAGITVIRLDDAETRRFLDRASQAGWDSIARVSPAHAPKLRELLDRK